MSKGIWLDKSTFMKFNEKPGDWKLTDEIASRKRSPDFSAIGGMLANPDPVLKKLGKDITVYKELSVEPHVGACILSRKSAVTSLFWEIGRGEEKTKEIEIVENRLKKLDVHKITREILDAPLYGYKPLEVIWENSEGLWLPASITGKPPQWFCFDEDNQLRFKSKNNWKGELLPEKKFLCPSYDADYENPYGKPELSKVFWSVAFKKGGWQFWVVFVEKYGMPVLLGKHPPGAPREEINKLTIALENAVRDAVIVISENSNVDLIESPFKASSTGTYKELHDTCNSEISKAILGQTLTTEAGDKGARSLGEVHEDVKDDITDSDQRLTEGTFNKLMEWVWDLNFSGEPPKFSMWKEEGIEREQKLANRDKTLSEAGAKFTKKYFMKTYKFNDEDVEIAEKTTLPGSAFSEPAQESSFPPAEIMKNISPEDLQKIAEDMLNPIIDLIQKGESYSEIIDKLKEQYPLMDTGGLMNLLESADFLAETKGRVDVMNE